MRLRLRQFEFRAITVRGPFGVTLPFAPGLVVLRGDNTSGKSTCLQGVIYALGLEGMLSASRAIPLPHVATSSLTDTTDGRELDVLESYVTLEFENEAGQIATVRRYAKHERIDTLLITVWDGPALTGADNRLKESAFFVRRRGGAQSEAGFHNWLASFLGWDLPEVPRFDGGTCPLYLETIFPLFYVEQKRGWAAIQPHMPTYLRIRDVGRRAVEFVLALSGGDLAARRQLVQERKTDVRQQWAAAVGAFRNGANEHGIVVQGVPAEPSAEWPVEPRASLCIATSDEGLEEWQPLGDEIERLREELAELDRRLLPRAEEAAPGVSAELQVSLRELHEVSSVASAVRSELAMEEDQVRSLDSRIAALQEDFRRSQDAEVLHRMGAPMSAVTPEDCPTCHQELPTTLLDPAAAIVPMPIERNIRLLKEQIDLFQAMRSDLDAAIAAKRQQMVTFDERIHALQQNVRAQRETLVSASGTPSIRDVEQRVHLRDRVEALTLVVGRLSSLNTELARLAQEWARVLGDEARLRDQGTPEADTDKIRALQSHFLTQLQEYGVTSLPISELTISEYTYQPELAGFDLGFEMSASDMVRCIWAYRIGLLEVGREFVDTRHAQLLVFDEPRQQSASPLSFTALFERAALAERTGQQVIFATSEPEVSLRAMLRGIPHSYLGFAGKMITRVDD
jgi:hypothetical protein